MKKGQGVSLGVLAVALMVTVVVLWSVVPRPTVDRPKPTQDPAGAKGVDSSSADVDTGVPARTLPPQRPWRDLTPEHVINSPDCRLVAGTGSARDIAVVVMETNGAGFWYAVVDRQGVAFGDFVPFEPSEEIVLRRTPHGSALVGFRGTGDGGAETWLVQDGQTTYQADETWYFNVAPDGSSSYAVEPLAGGASRLVIRNFSEEHHYDLGDTLQRTYLSSVFLFHRVAFSLTHDEVIIQPTNWPVGMRGGSYRFFPVDGGAPREIPNLDGSHPVLFQSSEVSYHIDVRTDGDRLSRVNRRFDSAGKEIQSDSVWSRDFPFDEFGTPTTIFPLILIAQDGTLLIRATELAGLALDTSSGATVISVPLGRESRIRRGRPTGIHYRDGRLLLYRYVEAVDPKTAGERFVEIFDAAIPNLGGIPDARLPIKSVPRKRFEGFALIDDAREGPYTHPRYARSKTPCAETALLDGRGLIAMDARLTYRIVTGPTPEPRPES